MKNGTEIEQTVVRVEQIKCVQCGLVQPARVVMEDWMPFPCYVHDCTGCGYTIMESEWDRQPEPSAPEPEDGIGGGRSTARSVKENSKIG